MPSADATIGAASEDGKAREHTAENRLCLSRFLCSSGGAVHAPVLKHHDRTSFEIICYSDVHVPDELTGRLRSPHGYLAHIVDFSDERAAELIRQDQIDILVDLTITRPAIACWSSREKPAPVQVTYSPIAQPRASMRSTTD